MLIWLWNNISTVIVCILIAALSALAIKKIVTDRKNGKTSCGGSCQGCPSAGECHRKK